MSREDNAPTAWLVGAIAVLGGLAAVLGSAIRPPTPVRDAPDDLLESHPAGPELERAPRGDRIPIGTTVLAAEAPQPAPPAKARGDEARGAAASLAASIDPAVFRGASFEVEARALASSLSPEEARELALVASDEDRAAAERVAAAEILRHVLPSAGIELPAGGLGSLRDAWEGRASDPVLAAAAVRALGAFGDASDRAALLAEAGGNAMLACAGLSAARGDEAAAELVDALGANVDVALAALTAIASAEDRGLSEAARARLAQALLRRPEETRSTRLLAAVAALDPELARPPLLAVIADAKAGSGAVQSAASALAAMPEAEAGLRQLLRDESLDGARRALAAEALLRLDADPWGEARGALERARDGAPGTAVQRRATRVLELAPDPAPGR